MPTAVSARSERIIRLGQITGAHGVKGWVGVRSYTEPRTNLFEYRRWLLEQDDQLRTVAVEALQESGRKLIAKLQGIDDRETAAALAGAGIGVRRRDMPAPSPGEYYWADLEGLAVLSLSGQPLGTVDRLLATGANDVLVLEGPDQHMIPFIEGDTVHRVDLDAGEIVVDWDPAFWE